MLYVKILNVRVSFCIKRLFVVRFMPELLRCFIVYDLFFWLIYEYCAEFSNSHFSLAKSSKILKEMLRNLVAFYV